MRKKLIAGNWKMNGRKAAIRELVSGVLSRLDARRPVDVMLLPPFVYLPMVHSLLAETPVMLGAQDVSEYPDGAYTGEVAGGMLAEFGCRHVLVGHSERRALYGDTDERVAAKFEAAQAAGLRPVLCLGETLEEREAGQTEAVVARQLEAVVDRTGIAALGSAVIAYEPVWAIGTGRSASPDQAQAVHAYIRQQIKTQDATIAGRVRILYGGSVKPENAADLFAREDIDGGLIGGASLSAEAFMGIYRAA